MPDPVRMTWSDFTRNQCWLHERRVRVSPQQANILATLLLHRGKPVRMTDLIESTWPDPDREPDDPRNVLGVQLTRLRRRLPGLILHHGCKTGWMIERAVTAPHAG